MSARLEELRARPEAREVRHAAEQIGRAFGKHDIDAIELNIWNTIETMNASTDRVLARLNTRPICGNCGHPEGYCGQC